MRETRHLPFIMMKSRLFVSRPQKPKYYFVSDEFRLRATSESQVQKYLSLNFLTGEQTKVRMERAVLRQPLSSTHQGSVVVKNQTVIYPLRVNPEPAVPERNER
jgi:hypothetical protein